MHPLKILVGFGSWETTALFIEDEKMFNLTYTWKASKVFEDVTVNTSSRNHHGTDTYVSGSHRAAQVMASNHYREFRVTRKIVPVAFNLDTYILVV